MTRPLCHLSDRFLPVFFFLKRLPAARKKCCIFKVRPCLVFLLLFVVCCLFLVGVSVGHVCDHGPRPVTACWPPTPLRDTAPWRCPTWRTSSPSLPSASTTPTATPQSSGRPSSAFPHSRRRHVVRRPVTWHCWGCGGGGALVGPALGALHSHSRSRSGPPAAGNSLSDDDVPLGMSLLPAAKGPHKPPLKQATPKRPEKDPDATSSPHT